MEADFKKIEKKVQKKMKGKFLFFAVIILFLGFLFWIFNSEYSTTSNFRLPFIDSNPLKSTDDRVNVLLLGIPGGKHDGPNLTDTIIIASYSLKSNKATLVSIPRDLWLESTKTKVNAVYHKGLQDDNGLEFAKDKIDDILGFPIHYAIRLDFNGFIKAVDLVSGIEVDVPQTFDDYNYPITGKENDLCGNKYEERELTEEQAKELNIPAGKQKLLIAPDGKVATDSAKEDIGAKYFVCRYEHIHFEKGITALDGEAALKFVRSRHGTQGEGSDFARSRRQQLVLQAFRNKVLSVETLANPQKIIGLINTFGDSIDTDIPADRYLDFYKLVKSMNGTNSVVLGNLGTGKSVLIAPSSGEYGGYVLIPPKNDFTSVKDFLKLTLASDSATEKR